METITRSTVASKMKNYLYNRISLPELVDWAEEAMNEGEFDDTDHDLIRDIIAKLGLADVKAFSLSWENITTFLGELGYAVSVKVVPQSSTKSS